MVELQEVVDDTDDDEVVTASPNPERLPKELMAHLEGFRDALLDENNEELRGVFEKRFDKDSGIT